MTEAINRDWVWNPAPQIEKGQEVRRMNVFPQVRLPRPGENVTGQIVNFLNQEVIDKCYRRSTPEFREKQTEKKTLVIGIGGRARHGKDTVAEHIIKKFGSAYTTCQGSLDIRSYGFADELKVEVFDFLQSCHFYFGVYGPTYPMPLPLTEWELSRKQKIEWCNNFKTQIREYLQKHGAEFRRSQNENYWIEKTKQQIEEERTQVAILRDLRFTNEVAICDVTVKVERLGYVEQDGNVGKHVSETELGSIPFDYTISVPDGQLGLLKSEAEVVFEQILSKWK